MKPITHPVAKFFIYLGLTLFLVYSIFPFYWTALQSLKTVRDAHVTHPHLLLYPDVRAL